MLLGGKVSHVTGDANTMEGDRLGVPTKFVSSFELTYNKTQNTDKQSSKIFEKATKNMPL